jgi:hypothetical protein
MIYLALFVFLVSKNAGDYLSKINKDDVHSGDHTSDSELDYSGAILTLIVSTLTSYFWVKFMIIECRQLYSEGFDYFFDYWNWIDLTSATLNMIFLISVNLDVLSNHQIVTIEWVRTIGAVACWMMWFKVFYWMRLFKKTAHFITLISTTIYDIRIFSIMLVIILIAFANFFFVINNN